MSPPVRLRNLREGFCICQIDFAIASTYNAAREMDMSAPTLGGLSGVAETLLIPPCVRAIESQRPDARLKDDKAGALVRQMGVDPSRVLACIAGQTQVAVVLPRMRWVRYIPLLARTTGVFHFRLGENTVSCHGRNGTLGRKISCCFFCVFCVIRG